MLNQLNTCLLDKKAENVDFVNARANNIPPIMSCTITLQWFETFPKSK